MKLMSGRATLRALEEIQSRRTFTQSEYETYIKLKELQVTGKLTKNLSIMLT